MNYKGRIFQSKESMWEKYSNGKSSDWESNGHILYIRDRWGNWLSFNKLDSRIPIDGIVWYSPSVSNIGTHTVTVINQRE